MTFFLLLKTDKFLNYTPHLDSIYINIDGKSVCCTWDESDAGIYQDHLTYRCKGVYFDDEYANGKLNKKSIVKIEEINWQEDDNSEDFKYEIGIFLIRDNGVYTRCI